MNKDLKTEFQLTYDLGDRLTDSCKDFGECWIYVNDDQTLSI